MRDGFVESFNGRLRDECLNEHFLTNLRHVGSCSLLGATTTITIPPHTNLDGSRRGSITKA